MPKVDTAPTSATPPELVEAPQYPIVNVLRRHGDELAAVSAIGVFCALLAASRKPDAGAILRAAVVAAIVGVGVKNLSELNSIIADTLLPQ